MIFFFNNYFFIYHKPTVQQLQQQLNINIIIILYENSIFGNNSIFGKLILNSKLGKYDFF